MAIGASDAVQMLRLLISAIGDARAWKLEIRKWAYDQAGGDRVEAEALERWVTVVDTPLKGTRHEALRMWAWDHTALHWSALRMWAWDHTALHWSTVPRSQLFGEADELYRWALQAEDRALGEPAAPGEPPKSFTP